MCDCLVTYPNFRGELFFDSDLWGFRPKGFTDLLKERQTTMKQTKEVNQHKNSYDIQSTQEFL